MGTDHGFSDLVPRGTGPVATVYAGIVAGTGEAVAIKVFPTRLPRRTRAEVERELSRLALLREPPCPRRCATATSTSTPAVAPPTGQAGC